MADCSVVLPRCSGVYEIVNTINGKRYVGSAVNFARRWRAHLRCLRAGNHHSEKLQRAWNKYGADAFEFRIIASCEASALIDSEQCAIDSMNPEYNMSPTAGSTAGMKHRPEAAARHSTASTGRRLSESAKALIAAAQLGRKHPPEFGAAISARQRGIARPKTDEHRHKISESLKGHSYNAGIPKSAEHKEKLSQARRGVANPKNVGNKSRSGMKTSPEIVERQRAGLRAYWARKKIAAAP